MPETEKYLFDDKSFRALMSISAGLGLSVMVGSLASIQLGPDGGFQFAWHWSIVIWMIATGFLNALFWKSLWRYDKDKTVQNKRKLIRMSALLVLLGIGSFLYPIRFIAAIHHSEVVPGLITAAIFLGILGWLMYTIKI